MAVVGGLRRRLIKDNFYYMVYNAMSDLNWFNSNLASKPVTLLAEQIDPTTKITPNKVSIAAEEMSTREWEMGSDLDQFSWEIYLDIFAEDESVGTHLSGDIYDILKGKMSNIGRTGPFFNVYDLTQEAEPLLFTCGIERIETARVREWNKDFNKYWWVVGCTVVDYYSGE